MIKPDEPRLTDEDIELLIGFLGQRNTIAKPIIEVVIQALISLKTDRANLAQKLEKTDV